MRTDDFYLTITTSASFSLVDTSQLIWFAIGQLTHIPAKASAEICVSCAYHINQWLIGGAEE